MKKPNGLQGNLLYPLLEFFYKLLLQCSRNVHTVEEQIESNEVVCPKGLQDR